MKRLALLLIAVPAIASAQAQLRGQADSLLVGMVAAFKASAATTATFYTDDAALIGGGQRIVGREGVNRYWAGTTPGSTWSLQLLDVGGDADAPWVHGKSSFAPPGGQPFVTEFLGLLQRGTDGKLRFRVDAYAAVRGAPTSPAADEAAVRGLDSLWGRMYAKHDTAAAEWKFAMSGGAPREIRRNYMAVYSRGGPLGWRIVAMQMR